MKFDHDRMLDSIVARQRWARVRVRVMGLIILLGLIAFPARWFVQEWLKDITPTLVVHVPPTPPLIVQDAIVLSQVDDQRQLNNALKLDRQSFVESFPVLLPGDAADHRVSLSDAYIVELETYNEFGQAMVDVEKLRGDGYRAFVSLVDPEKSLESAVFRVVVGPDLRRDVVDRWCAELLNDGFSAEVRPWSAGDTNRIENYSPNEESG